MAFVPGAGTGIAVFRNGATLGLALGRNVQDRPVEMLYGLEPKVEELAKAELGQIAKIEPDGPWVEPPEGGGGLPNGLTPANTPFKLCQDG